MNAKYLINATLVALSLASGLSFAADSSEDEDMIITSKPHRLPRLMTLQTSEVLESYGVGFAGSGNIHSALNGSRDALKGAVYLGLGDVAELGYDMEMIRMQDVTPDRRMKGHIKLQPVAEGRYMPAFAVTYGTNLNNDVEIGSATPFGLQRQSWLLGASKSLSFGAYRVSVHPALGMNVDEITRVGDVNATKGRSSQQMFGQVGATWQTVDNTMFMFESKMVSILDTNVTVNQAQKYTYGYENNLGVRFYLRNWLFLDAGIVSMYEPRINSIDTGIHANISGLIPLKSIGERIWGNSKS